MGLCGMHGQSMPAVTCTATLAGQLIRMSLQPNRSRADIRLCGIFLENVQQRYRFFLDKFGIALFLGRGRLNPESGSPSPAGISRQVA